MTAGRIARIGLALIRPREALALAADRRHAGRSGSDLLVVICLLLAATQLDTIIAAVWLATAVDPVLGVRAIVQTLTNALVVDLAFLVVSALVVWAAAGPQRELGRAFDLACVAALPLLFVDLGATVFVDAIGVSVNRPMMWALSAVAYAWTAGLVVLAVIEVRRTVVPELMRVRAAQRAGLAVLAVAVIGVVVQTVWVARHLDRMRPMRPGDPAPMFTLSRIDERGARGTPFHLADTAGKVTVLDFWATWCGPCLKALPKLNRLQARHPGIVVIAINLDDAAAARTLFDERGWTLTLLAGDQQTSDRYGVAAIPHTVVIDQAGRVRRVARGAKVDFERDIADLLK